MRSLAAFLLVAGLAACGGTEVPPPPGAPRTIELGWRESEGGFTVEVHRLVLHREGWSAEIAFSNRTGATLTIDWPHRPGRVKFGLVLTAGRERAELERTIVPGVGPPFEPAPRFEPPLPRIVEPGTRRSGTMSGDRPLPRGRVVRVLLGRFIARQPLSSALGSHFSWVTEHAHRL